MDKCDVLVVGAGPAGSLAARTAAEKGLSVMMIEARPQVGVPVRCGEMMPSLQEIKDMFQGLRDPESLFEVPDDLVLREVDGIRLTAPNDRKWLIPWTGYTTDRDRFDQRLADLAVEAGANLVKPCRFERLSAKDVAVTSEGEVGFRVIVGADGPGSRTARSLGLPANRNCYPAVTAQVKGDFGTETQMFFGKIAPSAYGWIIPKKGCANVGVGFSPKFSHGSLSDYMDRFVKDHDLEVTTPYKGKYVPSEGPIGKTFTDNGMLVGDAAGVVMSVNGGGIPQAMITGRMAGEAACAHISEGKSLQAYEEEWRAVLYKPLHIAANNKKLADTFAFHWDWSTSLCMRILGARRMGKLIRCDHLFPRSALLPVRAHRRAAYRTLVGLLLEPLAASDALVVPGRALLDPLLPHRSERYAHGAGRVLDGVVVRQHRPAHVDRKCQHRHVDRREPPQVAGAPGGLLHLPERGLCAVRHPQHVAPEGEAGVLVLLELAVDAAGTHRLLLREGVHRHDRGAVEHEHAPSNGAPLYYPSQRLSSS